MNNNGELITRIKQLEKRVTSLESKFLEKKVLTQPDNDLKKSLGDRIIVLRDEKFFSTPQAGMETHERMLESYHCELNRVEVALVRLADKKQLRKTSKVIDGKKYKAYVW